MNQLSRSTCMRPLLRRSTVALHTRTLPQGSSATSLHSFSEPSFFVYRGWHRAGSHFHSTSSYDQLQDDRVMDGLEPQPGAQLRDSRIMSPKADTEQSNVDWDEDYDEFNLHTPPTQVMNRSQTVHNVEPVESSDIYSVDSDNSVPDYTWNVADTPNNWLETFYNEKGTNAEDGTGIVYDF